MKFKLGLVRIYRDKRRRISKGPPGNGISRSLVEFSNISQLKFQYYKFLSSRLRRKEKRPMRRTGKQRSVSLQSKCRRKNLFPNHFVPLFQNESSTGAHGSQEKPVSYENEFDLHENQPVSRKHFHINGFARFDTLGPTLGAVHTST